MSQKLSDTVLKLLELARPSFVNGRWRKPAVSGRELAMMKKHLVAQGEHWPEKKLRNRGGDKPLKLSKWERGREARQAMIAENMQKMPQMIEDYRKRVYEIRETNRKKKERSEQEEYLLATGQKQQRPAWQEFKDKRKPKR